MKFLKSFIGVLSIASAEAANIGTHNNQCFDASINNNQLPNGAAFQQWQCASTWNQNWDIGNYALCLEKTNKCVDVKNGDGYNTQIWDRSGGRNQKFSYKDNGQFEWSNSGKCLAVPNYKYQNGVGLVLDDCWKNTDNMVFSINGAIGYQAVIQQQKGGSGSGSSLGGVLAQVPSTAWVKQLFPQKRLLSWAEDDRYYNNLNKGSKIAGLMHWEHGNVAGNNRIWLPQFWGDRKWDQWNKRKAEIQASGKVPPVVLSFNEPDLAVGQNSEASAGMDPYYAAQVHKREIEDVFRPKGSKIVGPQWGSIWNEDYINKFMGECKKLGCAFDAMGLHHYESMKDGVDAAVKNTIAQVEKAYAKFNLPLFITELGFSSAGGGTDQQFIEYLQKIGKYLDNTDKVAVWALSAVQRKSNGGWGNDGGFMSSTFAFFNSDYSVTDLGQKYMWDDF